jgi:hypothetical protein
MLTKNISLHNKIAQLIKMIVPLGPFPHANIHIRIKQLIKLFVRVPCPHDNIHQVYYNFKTGILTYFLKAFEFHLPMD